MVIKIRKFFYKFSRRFSLTKREKFAAIVIILTSGLLLIQILGPERRYLFILALSILSYFLCVWGLREDINDIEWLTLFILPVMFVAAIPLFYFLLPVRWLTRLPTAIIFAVGVYAILLVENIYNVAAERTIQLLRAAHSVGLLITLFTLFLLLSIVFSLHLYFYWNFLLVFLISFPLVLQSLWGMKLESYLSKELLVFTTIISLILAQLALVLSFWPVQTVIETLLLATVFYTLVGIIQQELIERLFKKSLVEFITVLIMVFILFLLTTGKIF